jgi:phage host-nuclease inhibitor protein Gam
MNHIVKHAISLPVEKDSISHKIQKFCDLCIEIQRLNRILEANEPTEFVITEAKLAIKKAKKLKKDIDAWQDTCTMKIVSY